MRRTLLSSEFEVKPTLSRRATLQQVIEQARSANRAEYTPRLTLCGILRGAAELAALIAFITFIMVACFQ